jgi:hypothetical protein
VPKWVNRTYTYSEPEGDPDTKPNSNGIDGPDTLPFRGAGSRPDYDAGYEDGKRAGWVAGYEYARQLRNHDLAVDEDGRKPVLSAIMRP